MAQKKESDALQSRHELEENMQRMERERRVLDEKVQQSNDNSQQITELINEKLHLSKLQEVRSLF